MFGEEFYGGGRANFDLFQAPAFQGGVRPFFQRVTLGLYALPARRAITGLITSE
jgi:hypothetical protein